MSRKYFSIFLLMVVMVCCVSAASATDVDNITVPDDTNIITDDIVESVDDVESDDVSGSDDMEADLIDNDDVEIIDGNKIVEEPTRNHTVSVQVTNTNYYKYFNWQTGVLTAQGVDLEFTGNFNAKPFTNFIINNPTDINATTATFENVGFSFISGNITLTGQEM